MIIHYGYHSVTSKCVANPYTKHCPLNLIVITVVLKGSFEYYTQGEAQNTSPRPSILLMVKPGLT